MPLSIQDRRQCVSFTLQNPRFRQKWDRCLKAHRVERTIPEEIKIDRLSMPHLHRNRRAARIEALVGEGPEMVPATNL
jgi:hypothetical protein